MSKRLKTRKRYRLIFVNDNTLNTVWTLRMTRTRVWCLTALCVAAVAALAVCIVVASPVSYLLPGYMRPEQRRNTVDNTLRVDSLLAAARQQQLYLDNIASILSSTDTTATAPAAAEEPAEVTDTLIAASEAERAFVESWFDRERGNLSVLTPVVTEGMMFRSPAVGATIIDGRDNELRAPREATVVAIQDGVVTDVRVDAATGRTTVTLQHASDFMSICSGLKNTAVISGQRVVAGQALGRLATDGRMTLTLWHQGSRVPLSTLLGQ